MKSRDAWPYSEEDDPGAWGKATSQSDRGPAKASAVAKAPAAASAGDGAAAGRTSLPATPSASPPQAHDEPDGPVSENVAYPATTSGGTGSAAPSRLANSNTVPAFPAAISNTAAASAGSSPPTASVPPGAGPSDRAPAEALATDAGAAARAVLAARQPRVVATIIDPSVREDGRGDPQLVMQTRGERNGVARRSAGEPHPVRERLLARARTALSANAIGAAPLPEREGASGDDWFAREASQRGEAAEQGDAPEPGVDAPPEVADDLDLIGAPERARPERTPRVAPALPAPTALLLGSLAGLAAIAALFAALVRFDPHEEVLRLPEAPPVEAPAPVVDVAPPAKVGKVQRPVHTPVPGPWRIADAAADARLRTLSASMGRQTFLAATQSAGIDLREAYRVLTAFAGLKNLDRCRAKDTFTALVDGQSGRLTAFEYTASEEDVFQAREGGDGKLVARKLDLAVKRHRAQGIVVLDGSFEESARRAGFEPGLGEFVNKALSGYVSTADMKAGDVLGLVVQEVTVLGNFSRYAGVEALEYRPVSGERYRIYYQELDKSRGYVDNKGRVFGKSRWTRPVPGANVTSRYNPRRMHPILKRIKPHNGTDFGAPIGTPVVAASAGKVAFVGRAGPNGNMVTVAHDGGYQTGYSHLSRFARGLKAGARVEQLQTLGYVGSTGRSTGPHLHFSAKKAGRFIDPESLNLDGLLRLTVDQRLSSDLRRRYDRMLDGLKLPEPRPPATLTARADAAAREPGRPIAVEIASARAAPPRNPPATASINTVMSAAPAPAPNAAPAPSASATVATMTSGAPPASTNERPAGSAAASAAPTSTSETPAASPAFTEPVTSVEPSSSSSPPGLAPAAP